VQSTSGATAGGSAKLKCRAKIPPLRIATISLAAMRRERGAEKQSLRESIVRERSKDF